MQSSMSNNSENGTVLLCNDCEKMCTLPDPNIQDSILCVLRTGHLVSTPRAVIDNKIADMAKQLEAYEGELDRLGGIWEKVLKARNDVRYCIRAYDSVTSPIRRLPVELLLTVFQMVCAAVDDVLFPIDRFEEEAELELYKAPLHLAGVCSFWRTLCYSSAGLWVRFQAGSTPKFSLRWEHVGALKVVMRQELPCLELAPMHRDGQQPCHRMAISLLGGFPPVGNNKPILDPESDVFASVQMLALSAPAGYHLHMPLSLDMANLRHLFLYNVGRFDHVSITTRRLKSLWLEGYTTMSEIPIILSKFPGRLELTLHKCTFLAVESAPRYRKVCNVTSLHISCWARPKTIRRIFETFTFPHLTSLKLTGTEPENDVISQYMDEMELFVEVLRAGLEQCPVLTELKLHDVGIFASDLLDILYSMKRLTSLSVIEPKKGFPWQSTLKTYLIKELKESAKEGILLPLLEELELVWAGDLGVDEDEMMDMVESLATFGKLGKVVIGGREGADVRSVTEDRMKTLREKGVSATLCFCLNAGPWRLSICSSAVASVLAIFVSSVIGIIGRDTYLSRIFGLS
ncbi:hypothetical protein BDZ89DRAFT_1064510 [Hymenopellis radicata]|nr:hypothetical protein BDZ89DRAFT_1064510 [Hymenopellis radicata]